MARQNKQCGLRAFGWFSLTARYKGFFVAKMITKTAFRAAREKETHTHTQVVNTCAYALECKVDESIVFKDDCILDTIE